METRVGGKKPSTSAVRPATTRVVDIKFELLDNLRHSGSVHITVRSGSVRMATSEAKTVEGRAVLQAWVRLPLDAESQNVELALHRFVASQHIAELRLALVRGLLPMNDVEQASGGFRRVTVGLMEAPTLAQIKERATPQRGGSGALSSAGSGGADPGADKAVAVVAVPGAEKAAGGAPASGGGGGGGGPLVWEQPLTSLAAAGSGKGPTLLQLSYRVLWVPTTDLPLPELPVAPLPKCAHSYGHGGFMGAALTMMGDPKWRDIFKQVAPKDYTKAHWHWQHHNKSSASAQCKLMLELENSPVLCAYGVVRTGCCGDVGGLSTGDKGEAPSKARLRWQSAIKKVQSQVIQKKQDAWARALRQQLLGAKLKAPEEGKDKEGLSPKAVVEEESDDLRILRLKALAHVDRMTQPNRYGYTPIALEWDIWMSPTSPEKVEQATVDHGSPAALVTQAITTALPCCGGLAESAGMKQILNMGISPSEWLNQFGRSINLAANGDVDTPLPLQGPQGYCFRLHLEVQRGAGGALGQAGKWDGMYVVAAVDGQPAALTELRTKAAAVAPGGGSVWDEQLAFWPLLLPDAATGSDPAVRIELRGDPVGMVRDKGIGVVYIPLAWLLERIGWKGKQVGSCAGELQHGQKSDAVEAWWSLGPKEKRGERGSQAIGSGAIQVTTSDSQDEPGTKLIRLGPASAPNSPAASAPNSPAAAGDGDGAAEEDGSESGGGGERLRLSLRLEVVSHMAAAQAIGVTPAAAQSCLAMLAEPGGLYLDVKSAYSSAEHCMLFVGALAGMGVNAKAVCSFKPNQLPPSYPSVLFFHGLNGLENAADSGLVPKGQFVLFNGASFLLDLKGMQDAVSAAFSDALLRDPATGKRLPPGHHTTADGAAADQLPLLIDPFVWRQYVALSERYGFVGGIYIQEPDASAAMVDALCRLVAQSPLYLPLGFAFGSVSGAAASFPDLAGRGFAAQALLEELAARKELSSKVMQRIQDGQTKRATPVTTISWGHRLLTGSRYMSRREQRLFIKLLSEMFPRIKLPEVVRKLGGVERVLEKYFETYEAYTPLNIFEQSFNMYYIKSLLRVLRNLGVLKALTPEEKVALAKHLGGAPMFGSLDNYFFLSRGIRTTRHKFAREGLACLLESCTATEAGEVKGVLQEWTGHRLEALLRKGSTYMKRVKAVDALHQGDPDALAYQDPDNKYASLEVLDCEPPTTYLHTRDKTSGEKASKAARKCGFGFLMLVYNMLVGLLTLFLWHIWYFGHLLWVAWNT